jgi:hypothetical protein
MKIGFVKYHDNQVANSILSFEKALLETKCLSNLKINELDMPFQDGTLEELDAIFVFNKDSTSIDYLKSRNVSYFTFDEASACVDDTWKRIHQIVLEMYKETLTKYVVYNVMPDYVIQEYVVDELEEKQLGNAFRNKEDAIKALKCRIKQGIMYSKQQIDNFYTSIQDEVNKISKFEEMLAEYDNVESDAEENSNCITYAYDVKTKNGTKQEHFEVSLTMKEYEEELKNAIIVNLCSTVRSSSKN